ncbi:MAG: hypothetical protein ABI823_20305 [Bryobacteraceae bacterium]
MHCLPGIVSPAWAGPPQDPAPKLNIVIVEGEGAINNVRQRVNREPIVQVEDENHKPIAGVAVVFFLPSQGPGGVFLDGGRSLTTFTDSQGRAVMRGFRPNNLQGKFDIRVTASQNGLTASTTIHQSSIAATSAAGASTGLSLGAKWAIAIAVIGGAAAAGSAVALTRGGGSSAPAVIPASVLTPGTPVVGGPK